MTLLWIFLGIVVFIVLLSFAAKKDGEKGVGQYSNNIPPQKKCPYCYSTDWQYAGQSTIGATDAKVKTQYKANLNPLKPFTLVDKKEKVVKKANPGITYDEFICLNCGKRFR